MLDRVEINRVGIGHAAQEKSLWRSGTSGAASVLFVDNPGKIADRYFAASYVDECAYDGADHIAQETVRRNREEQQIFVLVFPCGMRHPTEVGLVVGMQLAETRKIAMGEQQCCGFIHFIHVEWPVHLIGGVDSERIFPEGHAVLVGSGTGRRSGRGRSALQAGMRRMAMSCGSKAFRW